jgi:Zn-dependent protease with chaperone function
MDFFAAQDEARRRSHRLLWLYVAAVAGIVGSVYLGLIVLVGQGPSLWEPVFFAWVAGGVISVIGIASVGKILALRSGGPAVAASLGGRRVDPGTADPEERRLLNVVEEMAIASGLPVPAVYILPHEGGINAFAAGFSPDDAALGFTRGCVKKLNRDELQGVVAHEFSHVLNGDMRLNIQLVGLLFGILVLSIIGEGLVRVAARGQRGGRRGKDGASGVVLLFSVGATLFIAGWIGVFFGRLIQSAVSRQREYLADAAAVQFTRNPDGLSHALQKIGAGGSRVGHQHSRDLAHLFFANGLRMSFGGWFDTHPPLEQRIKAIDPAWDGRFPGKESAAEPPPVPPAPQAPAVPPPLPAVAAVAAAAVLPSPAALEEARAIRESLQARCGVGMRDPLEARALVFALLIADSLEPARAVQLDYLRGSGGAELEEAVAERLKGLDGLPENERLPLVEMLLPVLSILDPEGRRQFLQRVERVVVADNQVTFFAFVTAWMVRRHLLPPERLRPVDRADQLAAPAAGFFAFLAGLDATGERAETVFAGAVRSSPVFASIVTWPGTTEADYDALGAALRELSSANYALRKEVLAVATRIVEADGLKSDREREVMRFTAAALGCASFLAPSAQD